MQASNASFLEYNSLTNKYKTGMHNIFDIIYINLRANSELPNNA